MVPFEDDTATLPKGCAVCGKTETLLRCSACKVLTYCGRDHQTQHRSAHKSACNAVKKARQVSDQAKQDLINNPTFLNDNPFVHHVGNFSRLPETRPYVMSISRLIRAIQLIQHADSMQAELDCLMDMLRLGPDIDTGLRESIPTVMIRLNKDQECYDFLKWWETRANDDNAKFLDIKNADILESVDFVRSKRHGELPMTLSLMLLKIKFLIDLLKLQEIEGKITEMKAEIQSGALEGPAPQLMEIFLADFRGRGLASPAIRARADLLDGQDLSPKINTLKQQIDKLYDVINNHNKHVWPTMKYPDKVLAQTPHPINVFAMGSEEEMKIALHQTWPAWAEIPGSLEFIIFKIDGISHLL
ncbi:hypothetical protein N7466_003712 [Penicillium verhagenii]|uniref:uncharacterized protein n=1 Tax=Penicillium verhagenii TaxID=1562060 RepID=UPI0025454582|nr:uncharacterized protein N7466_003712 [Penicillium verhagenii]KAJ5934165.1 hypothetical protein N7466_003712 [Penicillium verhagenii]